MKLDGIKNAAWEMKPQYRKNARWLFSPELCLQLAKLKDGEGNYLLRSDVTKAEAKSLLGYPIDESEFVPSTFTSGLYVGALIDWSTYWIVDSLNMQVALIDQLYAESNQDLWIIRTETDGCCVDEKGVIRVKLG